MPPDLHPVSRRDQNERDCRDQNERKPRRPREEFAAFAIRDFGATIKETAIEWNADRAQRLGAALAFYTLFSLSPLIVILIAVLAMILGKQAAEGQLATAFNRTAGGEGAKVLQTLILNASKPGTGVFATAISGITLIVSASAVASELQDSLNTIWHVPKTPCSVLVSIVTLVKDRVYSLAMILGAGVLLLLSVSLEAWVAAILKYFNGAVGFPRGTLQGAAFVVTFAAVTLILAAIYKVLPDVELTWTDVFLGALFTALLLTLGKEPLEFYLEKISVRSSYGAAGSLAAVLIWIYYSAQMFYFGAEFTKIYARRHGSQAA